MSYTSQGFSLNSIKLKNKNIKRAIIFSFLLNILIVSLVIIYGD